MEQLIGWLSEWSSDGDPFLMSETFKIVEAASSYDAYSMHGMFLPSFQGRCLRKVRVFLVDAELAADLVCQATRWRGVSPPFVAAQDSCNSLLSSTAKRIKRLEGEMAKFNQVRPFFFLSRGLDSAILSS